MLWVAQQVGLPAVLSAEVWSADQFLPAEYGGTAENVQTMLASMCRPLQLAPDEIQLELSGGDCGGGECDSHAKEDAPAAAIRIEQNLLGNPYAVLAALARGLALTQLPHQSAMATTSHLVGWLADLTAVCFGWGAVVGHAASDLVAPGHSCGCGPGQTSPGLPAHMTGYAAALFAYIRGESRPAWKDSLRLDALVACDRSLRYLHRTNDTLFTVENASRGAEPRTTHAILQQLAAGSPSARVAALWELRDPDRAADAAEPVSRCLSDRNPAIREEAAKTVAAFGPAAQNAVPALVDLLEDYNSSIRAAAAHALGAIGTSAEDLVVHLTPLLRDPDRSVVLGAAGAIEAIGVPGEEAIPNVLRALRAALIRCDHSLIDSLTQTLYTLDPDPTDRVMEFFDDDHELREQMVHIIVDALGDQENDSVA